MKRGAIQNPLSIHTPELPLYVLGVDPGSTSGYVFVKFNSRRKDGAPLWQDAWLLSALTIGKPTKKGASDAELDIMHRRRIFEVLDNDGDTPPTVCAAAIVALEEPLDGADFYSGQGQGARRQSTGTAFRLGVHYANCLAGCAMATRGGARFVSFPARTTGERRGWMQARTARLHTLNAADRLLRSITTRAQYDVIPREGSGDRKGQVVAHLLMALGVINHLAEYYTEYFPLEK